MRSLVAAATIAACVVISVAVSAQPGGDQRLAAFTAAPALAPVIKQTAVPVKPNTNTRATGGNDSCRWANDRECDDPDIGTGACTMGTDVSDCRAVRAGDNDSCQWANDHECDEPHFGTGACVQATDLTDCGNLSGLRNQIDSCATAFNGICEEPGRGAGSCAARSDRSDCLGRERPLSINDHFFGRDDRVLVPVNQRPWSFMGEFTTTAGDMCTATLIARNVIVTAAHCIHTDRGVNAAGTFQPAGGGRSARVVAYLVDQRFDYRRFGEGNGRDGLDWALLRLDTPLGDELGFAGVQNLTGQGQAVAAAADLMQAGYSWDTGGHLSGNLRCRMIQVNRDNSFAHECDTTRGDSGSGFLVRNGDGFDLVGVDSRFDPIENGPQRYIAVSASAFVPRLDDFVAGRSGFRVGAQTGAAPRKPG